MRKFTGKEWWDLIQSIILIFLLLVLIWSVWFYIDRAEQISYSCGWEGEAISCVCEKKAYDFYMTGDVGVLDLDNITIVSPGYNS